MTGKVTTAATRTPAIARRLNTKLHVGNLPGWVTNEDLSEKFARFGIVDFALVVKDDLSGESCGFGLVEMGDASSAQAAIKWLNFSSYAGQVMAVSLFENGRSVH